MLLALAEEFRVPLEKDADQHLLLKGLTHALLECARNGQRALVCLDEAQAMPLESLEVLRLLTNLETEKRKLLQVVLFGQPELDERLKHDSIRQLRQRISFQYDLRGLRKNELDRYLRHRLAVAGFAGETLFSTGAVGKLHRITGGTPRLVNIVAHKALMLAFSDGRQQVLARHIRDAAADTPEVRRDWLPWAAGVDWCGSDRVIGHCLDGAAMSVINQVLNQLEQRGAHTAAEQTMVRAVPHARRNFTMPLLVFGLALVVGIAAWQWVQTRKPESRSRRWLQHTPVVIVKPESGVSAARICPPRG